MRITIAIKEDGYLEWLRAEEAVLASVAQVLEPRDHVLVRRGTLLDYGKIREAWLRNETDDGRRAVDVATTTRLTLFHLAGVPEAKVRTMVGQLRHCEAAVGVTVIEPSERQVLFYLESTLPLEFRFVGKRLRVLHEAAALLEDLDEPKNVVERLLGTGKFETVGLEDTGYEDTVFDDLNDGMNFVRRIELAQAAPNPWIAESVCVWLTSIEPSLRDALHAAVSSAAGAETREQAAQAALSVRRYLERLADVMFPPRDELYNGRKVTANAWKNRLCAALGDRAESAAELARLGSVLNDIKDRADRGVHHHPGISSNEARQIVADILELSDEVRAQCDPPTVAPDRPYAPTIREFMLRALAEDDPEI